MQKAFLGCVAESSVLYYLLREEAAGGDEPIQQTGRLRLLNDSSLQHLRTHSNTHPYDFPAQREVLRQIEALCCHILLNSG